MFNIRGFTKSVHSIARMLVKHQFRTRAREYLFSTSYDHTNDMANMATARRFMDDYMRRIESCVNKKEEDKKKDCDGNFKCEITRRYKRGGEVDCKCKLVCMVKISETMMIHEQAKREEK